MAFVIIIQIENLRAADFRSSAARRLPAFSGSPMHYSDQSICERKDIRPRGLTLYCCHMRVRRTRYIKRYSHNFGRRHQQLSVSR